MCRKANVSCVLISAPPSSQHPPGAQAPAHETNAQHTPSSTVSTVSTGTHQLNLSPSVLLSASEEHGGTPGHGSEDSIAVQLPPLNVCLHLATLYFDYVHDQLHSIFHRPSFMADVAVEKVSPVIMFAMVALAAR